MKFEAYPQSTSPLLSLTLGCAAAQNFQLRQNIVGQKPQYRWLV